MKRKTKMILDSEGEGDDWGRGEESEESGKEEIDVSMENIRSGMYVLAKFKGGKRNTLWYRYVCVVNKVNEDSLEVTGLKATGNEKKKYCLKEQDKATLDIRDVIQILPSPNISERGSIVFDEKVDVFESPTR